MSDIISIIITAINGVITKRTNIRNAIRNKGVSVEDNAKFSDFPSLIAQIGTGGGNVYYHPDNVNLNDEYYALGSGGPSECYGKYIKMPDTYHRGFNVYKHESNNAYLVAADDSGIGWEIDREPSSGRVARNPYWQEYTQDQGPFGPEGDYNPGGWHTDQTCNLYVSNNPSSSSVPSSSSSSSHEGSSSSEDYSGNAPSTLYISNASFGSFDANGTYQKQSQSRNGYAQYIGNTYMGQCILFVANSSDGKHAWVLCTNSDPNINTLDGQLYSRWESNDSKAISTTARNLSVALQSYPHGEKFIVNGGMELNPNISDTYSGGSC